MKNWSPIDFEPDRIISLDVRPLEVNHLFGTKKSLISCLILQLEFRNVLVTYRKLGVRNTLVPLYLM